MTDEPGSADDETHDESAAEDKFDSVLVPTGPDTALAIGTDAQLAQLGSALEEVSPALMTASVLGNAAKLLVNAGETTGRLVRLTKESSAALGRFGAWTDDSGAIFGGVRDSNNKFAKLIRFESANGAALAASAGTAIASIALQLQLHQISRQLTHMQESLDSLIERHELKTLASITSTAEALAMPLRLILDTGVVSDVQWSKVAALTGPVGEQAHEQAMRMTKAIERLNRVRRNGGSKERAAADRLMDLKKIRGQNPVQLVHAYVIAQQNVIAYETLHVHRLVTTRDPHLEQGRQQSAAKVHATLQALAETAKRFSDAVEQAGAGDLSSWNPLRNLLDSRDAVRLLVLQLRVHTKLLGNVGRSSEKYLAGQSQLALPAA